MFDVDRFVEDCRVALNGDSPRAAATEIVKRAVRDSATLVAALAKGEPGLQTLHHSPDLTIVHVSWTPGMVGFPHNHRMWAVVGMCAGQEDNRFYRRAANGLQEVRGRSLVEGETVVLGPNVIHAVSNPLRSFSYAIHVYGGDFFGQARSQWDPETLTERPFDMAATLRRFSQTASWGKVP